MSIELEAAINMDSIDQEIKELESGDDVDGITPEYVLKLLKEIKRLNQKNATLLDQCNNAESQLSIAFEIMTDRQIAKYQHLFNSTLHIGDSASTNHTQKGER